MKYCSHCGHSVVQKIPEMDNRMRYVCENCDFIHYQNPNVVVGTLPFIRDKVLLCRRAIEPQYGLWTLPAGFLENGETTLEGAQRETFEEAEAQIVSPYMYRVFDIPYINQVYIFYLGELEEGKHDKGVESLETALFSQDEIPWDQLAFPVVKDILQEYFKDKAEGQFHTRYGPPDLKGW